MFTASSRCASVVLAVVLSACGGGSGAATPNEGSSNAPPANGGEVVDLSGYPGTWRSICDVVSSNESEQATITLSAAGAGVSQLNFTNRMAVYSGTECTGAPVVGTTKGTLTFMGKKQVGTALVDRVLVRVTEVDAPNAPFVPRETRDLLTIINSRLYQGNTDVGAPLDGDGYPNELWMDYPSTRQQ